MAVLPEQLIIPLVVPPEDDRNRLEVVTVVQSTASEKLTVIATLTAILVELFGIDKEETVGGVVSKVMPPVPPPSLLPLQLARSARNAEVAKSQRNRFFENIVIPL